MKQILLDFLLMRSLIKSNCNLVWRTAHERSHQKMDDKEDKLKWPWERLANDEFSDLQESPRRSPSPMRYVFYYHHEYDFALEVCKSIFTISIVKTSKKQKHWRKSLTALGFKSYHWFFFKCPGFFISVAVNNCQFLKLSVTVLSIVDQKEAEQQRMYRDLYMTRDI